MADYELAGFTTSQAANDYQASVVADGTYPFAYVSYIDGDPNPYQVWAPEISGTRGYLYKAVASWVSSSQISIGRGQARSWDDAGWIYIDTPTTVDITVSGVNGLDTGSEANSTWYSVWVIRKSGTNINAGLLSTSTINPTMPTGYDLKRRVGWVYNGSTGNIRPFVTSDGVGPHRTVEWDLDLAANLQALAAGTATTFTSVSLSTLVPPANDLVAAHLEVRTNAVAGVDVKWSGANASTDGQRTLALGCQDIRVQMPNTTSILYANTVALGSTDIYVTGFEMEL